MLELTKEYAKENSLNHFLGNILMLQMEFSIESFHVDQVGEIFLEAFDCLTGEAQKLMEIEMLLAHATGKFFVNDF